MDPLYDLKPIGQAKKIGLSKRFALEEFRLHCPARPPERVVASSRILDWFALC
jgi:hypothetical protein